MLKINELLEVLAAEEEELRGRPFVAPCVGGTLWLRSGGLSISFTPEPKDFEGWGVFETIDTATAVLIQEAGPSLINEYLKCFKPIRLRLAYRMQGRTWLACPANEADARQRLGTRKPQAVQLVCQSLPFEQFIARWDGAVCWFEEIDRRADPMDAERLRQALLDQTLPAHLNWKNCTPEMRGCYVQAREQQKQKKQKLRQQSDEERLREALSFGGGRLHNFYDRGSYWQVDWDSPNGHVHTSAIEKRDLTVLSAGICLSGYDRDFDLQSLVKVVENEHDYW